MHSSKETQTRFHLSTSNIYSDCPKVSKTESNWILNTKKFVFNSLKYEKLKPYWDNLKT